MNLEELKKKTPQELIVQAEKLEIENPSTLRKQEILFAILKKLAEKNGCSFYKRVPALGIEENFIKGLETLILQPQTKSNFVSSVICPKSYKKCPCLELQLIHIYYLNQFI